MNKAEIKQIILEEIKAAISEQTEDERIAQAMETGDEEELENLAAGALDRAEQEVIDTLTKDYEGDIDDEDIAAISKDWNDEQDAMFGKPSFVEEDESLEEMARTSNVFKLKGNHTYDEVLRFMERVNNILKSYKTPGQKRPKKRFSAEDMKKVATALTSSSGFTSKDIRLAVDAYNSPAQANKFIKALEMKGYIELISQLKKAMKPERDPNAPETRGRKAKSAEFDVADDPTAMDFGDFDDLDLSGFDDIYENNTTMTNLEKYIKQQIKEDAGFGGAANLELKSAAKQIYQHFGSFAQAKILGRSADKSDRMKHFTAKGINPEEPYAVIFMNGSDVDPEEHLFVQIGAPSRDASKDAVAKIKAKFPKFEYKISESQSGKIFIANLVIKPGKTTSENKTTMSELEKYIKKVIKEAKNPLAQKMKEIENQGRIAALETKLAAIAEMIEETEGRLTRIDEDNEFRDMMDKNAVKEVRKQLKELERAQAKLQKEYGKATGKKGYKTKEVMDEDLPVAEDAVDIAVDEVELEEDNFALNESVKRMQKLANLKG